VQDGRIVADDRRTGPSALPPMFQRRAVQS
jgi:hypothetical protein